MLQVKQSSLIVHLAYLMRRKPAVTNLCSMFWSFVWSMVWPSVIGFILALYATWWIANSQEAIMFHLAVLLAATIIATLIGIIYLLADDGAGLPRKIVEYLEDTKPIEIAEAVYHGVKERYCPLIQIEKVGEK